MEKEAGRRPGRTRAAAADGAAADERRPPAERAGDDRIEPPEPGPGQDAPEPARTRRPAPGVKHEPEPDAGNIMPAEDEPGTL